MNLQEAAKRGINVLIPDPQFRQRYPYYVEKKEEKVENRKRFTSEDLKYNERSDSFTCPCGKVLEYKCDIKLRNNSGRKYMTRRTDYANCPLIDKCIARRSGKKSVITLYIAEKKYKDNLSEKMRKKIDNPAYRELYSRRMQIVEVILHGA